MCDVDLLKLYCIKVTGFPFFSVGTWRLLVGPTTNFEFLKLGTDIQTFDLNLKKKIDLTMGGCCSAQVKLILALPSLLYS